MKKNVTAMTRARIVPINQLSKPPRGNKSRRRHTGEVVIALVLLVYVYVLTALVFKSDP